MKLEYLSGEYKGLARDVLAKALQRVRDSELPVGDPSTSAIISKEQPRQRTSPEVVNREAVTLANRVLGSTRCKSSYLIGPYMNQQ